MQRRELGQTGFRPSVLGFGAMRLPTLPREGPAGEDAPEIDRSASRAMLCRALQLGVNYVDTAYGYHGGKSEAWVGDTLRELARELHPEVADPLAELRRRVKVATKLPVWKCETAADLDRYFEEQLERLRLPSVDFYLLHALDRERWPQIRDLGILDWAERQMADGRIGHFGFSFHDRYEAFVTILEATDLWGFCQIQLNYLDADFQAGLRGLSRAAERGLGVVVMEPVRGGQLARHPAAVEAIWDEAPVARTPAEWALRWVWDRPEVSLALSGMSTLAQVEENARVADVATPGSLSPEEHRLIDRVRDAYREMTVVPCTDCRYCLPCPQGVAIPAVLQLVNDVALHDDLEGSRVSYSWLDESERADRCEACGECEERCPQGIAISEWMRRADELLAGPRDGG